MANWRLDTAIVSNWYYGMDLILEHGLIRLAANPVSNRKTQGGVTLGSSFVMGASDWLTLAPSDLRQPPTSCLSLVRLFGRRCHGSYQLPAVENFPQLNLCHVERHYVCSTQPQSPQPVQHAPINTLHLQNSILRLAIKTMTYKTHFCALLLNQLVKVWWYSPCLMLWLAHWCNLP